MKIFLRSLCSLMALAMLVGCERGPSPGEGPQYRAAPKGTQVPVVRLAVHPLYNPTRLFEAYQPLADYLNANIQGARIELEASRDYQAYEAKLRAREPEFLLPNPWQTLEAIKAGYHVIAMAGDAEDFKGIFVVRRDSPIKVPADLKGKVVSYPSHTALAACIMPQYFLHRHGINVRKDIENHYVGSQESSILNAYLGQSAVAVTWPPPWRLFQRDHPKEAAELKLLWETPPLMNNSVMARNDVPAALRERIQALLVNLHERPEGKSILDGMTTARFHVADDAAYGKVRDYVATFEREVRPVEQP